MSKIRKNRGFTLAEVLIVVALVVVLSGVAFIAVWKKDAVLFSGLILSIRFVKPVLSVRSVIILT